MTEKWYVYKSNRDDDGWRQRRIEADARLLDQEGRPHLPGWAPDELRAADPTSRLRTLRDREQIAELTAEEYEADDRDERLADAIAAEDGAA